MQKQTSVKQIQKKVNEVYGDFYRIEARHPREIVGGIKVYADTITGAIVDFLRHNFNYRLRNIKTSEKEGLVAFFEPIEVTLR